MPAIVDSLAARWSLTVGEPFEPGGQCSWVAPAGAGRVLKIGWPHDEAAHEADGLRLWTGDGAVQLYAAGSFGGTSALLLERCVPGTLLARGLPASEQDVVIAGLLRRLWRHRPSGGPFRPLSDMCDAWVSEFTGAPALDPGIVRAGLTLLRALSRDATEQVLLHTDLHSENVRPAGGGAPTVGPGAAAGRAGREPWLAIDPKPYLGDPAYDVVQHMLNADRLRGDPRGLARRMAGLLDLDAERVRLWLFARCVQQSASWPELVEPAARLAP